MKSPPSTSSMASSARGRSFIPGANVITGDRRRDGAGVWRDGRRPGGSSGALVPAIGTAHAAARVARGADARRGLKYATAPTTHRPCGRQAATRCGDGALEPQAQDLSSLFAPNQSNPFSRPVQPAMMPYGPAGHMASLPANSALRIG